MTGTIFIAIAIIAALLLAYDLVSTIGIAMNSLFFYRLGWKKPFQAPDPIERDRLVRNIRLGASVMSLLHEDRGMILVRERFGLRRYLNRFLKLRAILYCGNIPARAELYFDPIGFAVLLLWIVLVSLPVFLTLMFAGAFFARGVVYVFAAWLCCVCAIYAVAARGLVRTIASYENFIKAVMGD